MIIDLRNNFNYEQMTQVRQHVYIDGQHITGVWYVDTEAGIAKSYNITLDPRRYRPVLARTFDRSKYPSGWELEEIDGIMSRTVRDKVELRTE